MEVQTELLMQLVAPLLDQTAGGDDQDAVCIGPQDEFAAIESRHDGLARARIVRQHIAQRLARQPARVWPGQMSVNCIGSSLCSRATAYFGPAGWSYLSMPEPSSG